MKNKYFIAVYTNEVKDYCDERFFQNVYMLSMGEQVVVIDNTTGKDYYNKLEKYILDNGFNNFSIYHLDVVSEPLESQFQRNICDSANYLRNLYLTQTKLPYFLILESDVYSPIDLLNKFENSIEQLNSQDDGWGIIGGLYYQGFYNYNFEKTRKILERTNHCMSGCTVYKRALIEKYPFRYDPKVLNLFPDAFISYDARSEYSLWNEQRIQCEHLYNPLNGLRRKVEISK